MSSTKTKRKRKRDGQKVDEGIKAESIKEGEEMEEAIIKEEEMNEKKIKEEEEEMRGLKEEAEVLVREVKLAKRRREQ